MRRLAAAVLLAVSAVLFAPAPAATAHATLLFTVPGVDDVVHTSPRSIRLVFDSSIVASGSSLALVDASGGPRQLGPPTRGADERTVTARILEELPQGTYVVRWEVVSPDGDAMEGEFRFSLGSASEAALGAAAPVSDSAASTAVLRGSQFLGLALALGGLLAEWLVRRTGPRADVASPPSWTLPGALIGTAASAALLLRFAGGRTPWEAVGRVFDASLLGATPGRAAALSLVAFGAATLLLVARQRLSAGLFLALVPLAEGLRAHPNLLAPGMGAVVTAVHVVVGTVWVGALLHVVRTSRSWRRQGVGAAPLVSAYARLAMGSFAAMVATGVVATLLVVPPARFASSMVDSGYGRWLLAKLAVVGVVVFLGAWARRHLRRRRELVQPSRAATLEVGALAAILALSGVLTALSPPVQADSPLPFAPPPVGPVVAVGGRAGFIHVAATASSGQLVVRLTTPNPNLTAASVEADEYDLAGSMREPGAAAASDLSFRRCGTGCFVAPRTWREGVSTVTLDAQARGWPGGATALAVSWPPRPGSQLLSAVVEAMREVGRFTLIERVTSDARKDSAPVELRLTGAAFVDTEPYASGVAPSATVTARAGSRRTLTLAYPGEETYVELLIGRTGRILRETVAARVHLTSRTFIYSNDQGG